MAIVYGIAVLDEVRPGLRALTPAMKKRRRKIMRTAGRIVRDRARRGVSGRGDANTLGRRTGGFVRSIIFRTRSERRADVFSTHPGARIHEKGGVIKAVRAPFLHFKWGPGPRDWAKVKQVTMPPRPWLAPAVKASKPALRILWRGSIKGALAEAKREGKRRPLAFQARTGSGKRQLFEHSAETTAAAGRLAELLGGGQ